ncbi:Thymidylate kinase [Caulifigura coniformis]|uniref:Thymidylate kinase n=1 Tax=Caulifigura coniformis TaxID=2527983 RepID=A0A517SGW0_9PLAN|nr:dTMP kinase [Caulifigura coniformis]QDT55368.1 Thymidylate kinase [Caulifigura coniformis]
MSTTSSGDRRGVLIAIEGIDGSGKGTQAALLRDALNARGRKTALISFPRYQDTFFGARIGDFLNGRFGSLDQVHPFLAATLFAGDRMESRSMLLEALAAHDVVILDRYVASNIAHQAAKREGAERKELARWILSLEFDVNALPRPDRTLLLDLPAATAQTLIARKNARSYTDRVADLQEADAAYLENVRQVYLDLAAEEPRWSLVEVERNEELRAIDDIAAEIMEAASR